MLRKMGMKGEKGAREGWVNEEGVGEGQGRSEEEKGWHQWYLLPFTKAAESTSFSLLVTYPILQDMT